MRVVSKSRNNYGTRRKGTASKWNDGYWHVVFFDEPDLTYVYSENDLRKLFEVEKEQED